MLYSVEGSCLSSAESSFETTGCAGLALGLPIGWVSLRADLFSPNCFTWFCLTSVWADFR